MSSSATFLRDVIDIPERAGADDYVLRLTEGVESSHAEATIRSYVVTDDLARNVDEALAQVAESVKDGASRAVYVHGSFGSGKSHFMAMLHALLGHNATVRSVPELAGVIAHYDPVLQDKKFLRLAFHFLDATSIEDVLLGGYLRQIRQLHPESSLPAIHRSDDLLADAEAMRQRSGDERFFEGLGDDADPDAGVWGGVVSNRWDRARYDAARAADPTSAARQELVTALTSTYFQSFHRGAEYVPLEQGLHAITEHAKGLGYHAVVTFLDELVLWLTFRVRDTEFFGREVQKLTKFVEGGTGARPIPLVSFIARQFDLRQYFADAGSGAGADQAAINAAFTQQAGRFRTITLGDDNLPFVAQKRLLSPRSNEARIVIDEAFDRLDRREEVWRVLLDGVNNDEQNRGADQQAFRRIYPFSPALVATLRHLAGAMQRDRTALKVMQSLLVQQRDVLTIDDVVPVGDVYDLVVRGAQGQAISSEMAGLFRNAHAVYTDKLRPLLLDAHHLSEQQADQTPPGHPFRADDRLVKTLVLSAIAPQVPALKELTPSRLAALNHGSITSPLPGQEATTVLAKLRTWAATVPEIHIGEGRQPVIRLRVAEVDYESIVQKAMREDNVGTRRRTLRRYVFEALKVDPEAQDDIEGVIRRPFVWRGSRREVEVVFGNVRNTAELPDARFVATDGTWRLVVDYPFDDENRSAREDLVRLDDLRGRMQSRTIAWVPTFLSAKTQVDLGRLVVLEWVLASPERWQNHSNHLSVENREQARTILENQRNLLQNQLRSAVQQAYGAGAVTPGVLVEDAGHDRVLVSLDPAFVPRAPVGATLEDAFARLLDGAYTSAYPRHPRFEPTDEEVRPRELVAVLAAVDAALPEGDRRAFVEPTQRPAVQRVANALQVGTMGETHFLFTAQTFPWNAEIEQGISRAQIADEAEVSVAQVRRWIRDARDAGLSSAVTDLVVCAWARHNDRAWFQHGAALAAVPDPGKLADSMTLRPQPMPSRASWTAAVDRAKRVFGTHTNPHLTAATLTTFDAAVRAQAGLHVAAVGPVVREVTIAYERLSLPTAGGGSGEQLDVESSAPPGRLATAQAAERLIGSLQAARTPVALVEVLAQAPASGTDEALARSMSSAPQVLAATTSFSWDRLAPLRKDRDADGDAILGRLRDAVQADEISAPLAPALARAETDAWDWVVRDRDDIVDPKDDESTKRPALGVMTRTLGPNDLLDTRLDEITQSLRALRASEPDATITVTWHVEPPG